MKKVLPAFLMGFLLSAAPALAATITTSNVPSSVGSDPFTLNVMVGGAASNTTNFLRVDLFKEGTTNYFGETYNGNIWYGGASGSAYFQVTIGSDGIIHTPITAKVGSPSATKYPGPGQYKLRIRRYTSSGAAAGSDTQTPADVYINIGTTPTPTATPTIEPTVEPTPEPTLEPTPTAEPTAQPTPEPTAEPTTQPTVMPTQEPTPEPTMTITPMPTITPYPTTKPHYFMPWNCFLTYRNVKIMWINIRFPKLVCERN